jgi:regulator of sirC expression with transglutaminase-like and TPR domain
VDPTTRFRELVESAGAGLDEGSLLIAGQARDVDVEANMGRLDELADGFVGTDVVDLCRYLFVDLGFGGNRGDYYDPRNSFLDCVLDRRLGIPLTLSIVAIEVGRRVGVPLVGIGMPGHFLVCDAQDPAGFCDPFAEGLPLDRAALEARFREVHGAGARLRPADLAPASTADMLSRMLANLHRIYLDAGDHQNLVWVLRLRAVFPGADPAIRRQLAGVLSATGRFWEAAAELDQLAVDEPARAAEHLVAAERLRARLN